MLRSLLLLAFGMLASSVIASAVASSAPKTTCAGTIIDPNASAALARALTGERCVARVSKPRI